MLTDWLIYLDLLEDYNYNTSFLRLITPITFGIFECHYYNYSSGFDDGYGFDDVYVYVFGFGDGFDDCYGCGDGNGYGFGDGDGYGLGYNYSNSYDEEY